MDSNEVEEKDTRECEEKSAVINLDTDIINAPEAIESTTKEISDNIERSSPNEAHGEVVDIEASSANEYIEVTKEIESDVDDDKYLTPEATDNESAQENVDDEPMDIDEILQSINADQDAITSSDEFSDAQSRPDNELVPQTSHSTKHDEIPNNETKDSNISPTIGAAADTDINNEENLSVIGNNIANECDLPNVNDIVMVTPNEVMEKTNNQDVNVEKTIQNANKMVKEVDSAKNEKNENIIDANDGIADEVVNANTDEVVMQIEQSETNDEPNIPQDTAIETANVLDLLMENRDLFGQTEANTDEASKMSQTNVEEMEIQLDVTKTEENVVLIESNIENTSDNLLNEETISEVEQMKSKEKIFHKECLNIDCVRKSDTFHDAPEFIINHFHLNKRQKMMYICEHCYDAVTESYEILCAALQDKQPLFLKNIKYTDLVEIIDSSDEEDEDEPKNNGDGEAFDTDTLALIENELETAIKETLNKVDINQQMDWNRQILTAKIDDNEKNCTEMMNEMKILQNRIDRMYTETYSFRHIFVEEVQSLDLQTLKPTEICNETYPPAGDIKHPEIQYNTLYYTFRNKLISRWIPCKVTNKMETIEPTEYSVKFCREKKGSNNIKTVLRKHLAYGHAPEYRLNIGTRVVALFDNADNAKTNKNSSLRNNFYPGVIAEHLSAYTNWRYLVFFDDGWVQYIYHENIRVVCECTENVWELIEEEGAKTFIEGYVKELKKKRPIVQVNRGQRIQTESGGKWYNGIVNAVDGSLVQIFFEDTRRYEWIYRGSTRLFPLYRKIKHLTPSANRNEATIEYIVIDDDKEPERSTEPPSEELPEPKAQSKIAPIQRTFASQAARDTPQQKQRDQKRAVAKKSTAPQPKPAIQHMNNSTIYVDEDKPKGKVIYYTAKNHIDVKKYIHHECQPSCLIQVHHNLSSYSPLSKPLLSGFERQISKTRFNKKYVVYKAPCGRRLRDMGEMHKYLRLTSAKLNVENFTFDPLIHCLAEYVIESYVMRKPDLSDGIEKMPVQLVNCYDNTMPPPCTYSAKRIPTEGVDLNSDGEFLCGCDCTDDCLDKTKCSCWKLTLQGAKYGNPDTPIEDVGYEYKRLNEAVPTGIYECNSRCKCKSSCLNRVVQHPLQLKLQVFKTVNRGWGLRCLNDVPKGSFICCYAGNLLTETSANEAGGDLGDEYFAELDYIEVVENMKEGYEPEVVNEDNDSTGTDEDFDVEMESMRARNDDSDDEFVAKSYTASVDSESRRYRTRNSVDTRKKTNQAPTNVADKRKERNSSSDEEGGEVRQVKNFMASNTMPLSDDPEDDRVKSIRKMFGKDEAVYIMDAKKAGNIGRYFNHSCGPNLFVQNVFVDTHDLRFPWVAFFASTHIRAGTELTWNYNYEVGSVPGKVLICQCGDEKCRGRIL